MKILIAKIILWIGALYVAALILPKPLFLLFFLLHVILPLWFMDERDSLEEHREKYNL